jgi:ribosomal protein S15P/S13E
MERRNRSLKALEELRYIDSLESYERADALVKWYGKYLNDMKVTDFDLEMKDFQALLELFYKNINFLKEHVKQTKEDMVTNRKMVRFLKN